MHEKMPNSHKKTNKFKISAPAQNEEFELPDGILQNSVPDGKNSVSDIEDHFKYIIKKT